MNQYMSNLKNYLLTYPDASLVSSGTEIAMRCRFCGDSQHDLGAKHLYIKIDGDFPVYNCFKCNRRGILNEDVIKQLNPQYGDADVEIMQETRRYVEESSKKFKSIKRHSVFNIYNNYICECKLSNLKLRYINNRIGTNLTFRDCIENNIVLNLSDLLKSNRIDEYTRNIDDINILNNYGIGFLSMDRGMVIIKNLADSGSLNKYLDHKYNVYSIFKGAESSQCFSIPTRVILDNPNPVHIHLAEGVFDILSIFYNLCSGVREQSVYVAACGKSYYSTFINLIKTTRLMNFVLHLYPDNDVNQNNKEIQYLIRLSKDMCFDMFIHRNTYMDEKDMGVLPEHIKEYIIKV